MSSRYVKLYSSLWGSGHRFRELEQRDQWAFMMLISQPDLSHAGVLALTTRRWATLAAGLELAAVVESLANLQAAGLVETDDATEELWVRGYMKHDGQHSNPNGLKAVRRAIEAIVSVKLHDLAISTLEHLPMPATATKTERSATPTDAAPVLPSVALDAIALLAQHRLAHAKDHVRSKKRYLDQVTRNAIAEHGAALIQAVSKDPTATAEQLAVVVFEISQADVATAGWTAKAEGRQR